MQDQKNLWRHTATDLPDGPTLNRNITTEVVIIGAGYTGLSAALHLAELGIAVCVVEARTVGHGGSGRNVGLVNAGLWTPPDEVEQKLGPLAGQRLNRLLADGPQYVFDLIEKYKIDCDAVRNGTLHCAHGSAGVKELQSRAQQQIGRGAPVSLLDATETAARTGATGLQGSLFDPRAGTIQPLAYARGLAEAATKAGAKIYQKTPCVSFNRDNGNWIVDTPSGHISARHLIQATNAYGNRSVNKNNFLTMHYTQFSTQCLNLNQRKAILPGGEGCWDTAKIMTSFRLSPDGRLVIGAIGNLDGFGGQVHRRWAERKLGALFPQLENVGFDFGWTGRVAISNNYLPKIAVIGPKALSIFGFSGRGISPGTVFGREVANWITTGDNNSLPVPVDTSTKQTSFRLKEIFYETGAIVTHAFAAR